MNVFKINIISLLISTIIAFIGTPFIFNMLKDGDCLCLNYKKESIPSSMGLLFVIVQTITVVLIGLYVKKDLIIIMLYLVGFILIGLVGLLDDLIGDEKVKGFKGHIKSFFKGTLTTGGLKAGIGFLIALIISIYISNGVLEVVVNTLVIALFTNLINLFDLRPGRASKVFVIMSIILMLTSIDNYFSFILFSFFGILIKYLPMDLKAKCMMGDVGSNTLGLTLGVYCAYTHSLNSKIIYLTILIIVQMLSEAISFSKVIEENKFLRFIDNLGR
ncbi:phospho-N-acetylmuramoyl-pentapeptide-transferase [Anaerosalibacter bizertensis]|uniref:Phospho-N-acetylmuramoyl-pentapeptide-transferase n=1 Tax=Anaerosalibacter bizertensis TaxID=932217 RepID=A0A844FFZ1_9FIRM|nr:phospho-N-acetylmuramoyl-pentapeptide-transferase [Anaerosalibacter bizertensis]MCB5558486.1 phospho-N-acetylmuramoyl-pentapeptide-transferase [Anaerosalibacter bizertensis]MCG4584326.1 phospho-N-acetylmuramoyl-pentapeptide-transferase [Anaerosalibacter bizertensis]MSS42891.1 phospho-N-acetylmuramoyl-pentapeptide-transferase [Anaerosalibacter bizertensis]